MSGKSFEFSSLKTRLGTRLDLKLGLALGLNLFAFVPYFWLQRHVIFPVTVMPQSALDIWLGFSPQAVWVYLSLFLLMPIAPLQMQETKQLWRYGLGVLVVSVAADLIFLFWPTAVVRPVDAAANPLYRSLTGVDRPLNAFPSLHAAMAVYSACCCEQIFSHVRRQRILRALVWIWALLISGAMLLVKQHVALDAAAGLVLGLTGYHVAFRKSAREQTQRVVETQIINREEWI